MQRLKGILSHIGFILLLLLPASIFYLSSGSEFLKNLIQFTQDNLILYLLTLLLIKSISIIYPPIAGVVFTLASVPLIGWKLAYLIDIVGSTIGTTASYYLGKRYGYSLLNRLLGQTITDKISKIKLKDKNQIEAAIFLRFAAGGVLSDGLAWGANLIGFRYFTFIVGFLISHLIISLPIFYFVGASISINSWVLILLTVVAAYVVIYKYKGRYFE